jgi:hypothetical protein
VEKKLKEYGLNKLAYRRKTPWYFKLLHEFTTLFSCLVWGGMTFAFIAYIMSPSDPSNVKLTHVKFKFYLAWVLIVVILLSGSVTYF